MNIVVSTVSPSVRVVGTGELASEFIEKAYWREHLASGQKPLVLHSVNGSPMKAATFLEKLYDLGITPSNSRPRVSNDNAFSESLFKTLKFRPGFLVNGFRTIEKARNWVLTFVRWYNTEYRHSALNYVTPQQRHDGEADQILAQRQQVIEAAKAQNPHRWSGDIRNFSLPESVTLNPDFAEKAFDVVGLYWNPPNNALLLLVNKKTQNRF